jgi:hypothetical protein
MENYICVIPCSEDASSVWLPLRSFYVAVVENHCDPLPSIHANTLIYGTLIRHQMDDYHSLRQRSEQPQSQRNHFASSLPSNVETWQQSPLSPHSSPYLQSLATTISSSTTRPLFSGVRTSALLQPSLGRRWRNFGARPPLTRLSVTRRLACFAKLHQQWQALAYHKPCSTPRA